MTPRWTNGAIVGQLERPADEDAEYFSVLLPKDSPLTDCVNQAIAALQSDGRLDAITEQWLTGWRTLRSCNRSRTFPRPRWACQEARVTSTIDPGGPREPLPFHRRSDREQSARSLTVAIASSLLVFGGLAWIITNSPGWRASRSRSSTPRSSPTRFPM